MRIDPLEKLVAAKLIKLCTNFVESKDLVLRYKSLSFHPYIEPDNFSPKPAV